MLARLAFANPTRFIEVDISKLNIALIMTPIVEWYVGLV